STFIAYGDTRSAEGTGVSPMHDDIVSKYLQFDPELILHTGDLVAHGGEPDNWPLFDESISAISDWDADLKCYYAAGNHEKYTKDYGPEDEDFSNYLSYVDFSDVVNGSEGETELYYSFDWQNIHFIFLNTIDGWTGDSFACPQAQWDWLNADLLSNDKEFIVVSMHNPSYSIRAERTDRWAQANSIRATFHELFQEEGVDIVFSGHDHQYYRTFRDGIQYVVTGGGGAPLYDIQTVGTVWQAGDVGFSEYHYCVCQIDESASTLTVKVYLLNGTIADSFASDLPTTTPAEPFPLLPIIVFIGATVAVIIVVALIIQRRR
ncbi:MAG: metallophosphoesterase family protein, partial [Candidatus Thorarchaeota archaeon]